MELGPPGGSGPSKAAETSMLSFEEEAAKLSKSEILALRRSHFCPAQSVSYANRDPLLIVRGEGAYLYDEQERAFLDTRNNVCHVGHAHPAVASAVAKQVTQLNTNTRYLHPNLVLLAKRLVATFPEGSGLEVCFFVNSGSEANDLACRLAYARSKSRNMIVVDHAYHGHTQQVIDISPYKWRDGESRPLIIKVPCPDTYRGPHRGDDAGMLYAKYVVDACKAAPEGQVAAFFMESGLSVAGVVMPPMGYLQNAYAAVRAAGGVCVADEVQTGFGRFGDYYWGFEQQGVVPDIVTMGKPFGNGMPLAAVVTTRAVSDAFHNGLEYFNTFGGNPVCCAAGLAVMDIVRDEQLQEKARETGVHFIAQLRALSDRRQLIGDVRGSGLFLGVEFVLDRASLAPATSETSEICTRMKEEYQILTSIDGPHDNVLVIKPPMCFGRKEVDIVIAALDTIMGSLTGGMGHTPT